MVKVFITTDKLFFNIDPVNVEVEDGEETPVPNVLYSAEGETSYISYENNTQTQDLINDQKYPNAKKDKFYNQRKIETGVNGQYKEISDPDAEAFLKGLTEVEHLKLELLLIFENDLSTNLLKFSNIPHNMNGFTAQAKVLDVLNDATETKFNYVMVSDETFTLDSSHYDFKSGLIYSFESKFVYDGSKWARVLL